MKYLQTAIPSGDFDYTTPPANIADQLRAAAERVCKLERAAVIEVGRTLTEVKQHLALAQQAIEAADLAVLATTVLLGSALPGPNSPHDIAEQKERRRRAKRPEAKEWASPSPWVVMHEPGSDRRRTRDESEEREWGGEANLRDHYACAAAKMLEQGLGENLGKFLAAARNTDPQAVWDPLRSRPSSAPRDAASATVPHAEDEPPLLFANNNASSVGVAAGLSRQDSPLDHMVQRHRPPRPVQMNYGEMRHRCLDAMRDGSAVTAESVVMQLMRDRSLDPQRDKYLRSDLVKRALRALDALRRCGRVEKIGRGRGVRWQLLAQ